LCGSGPLRRSQPRISDGTYAARPEIHAENAPRMALPPGIRAETPLETLSAGRSKNLLHMGQMVDGRESVIRCFFQALPLQQIVRRHINGTGFGPV